MEMTQVQSSNIKEIGWEEPRSERFPVEESLFGILYVRFSNNALYVYYAVEKELYEVFLQADSKGSFFSSFIRNNYKYERLS